MSLLFSGVQLHCPINRGLLNADQPAGGLIGVLESDLPLNGHW